MNLNNSSGLMNETIEQLNGQLIDYIRNLECPQTLKQSMEYSLAAGGKRIRPLLVFAVLHAFGKDLKWGMPVACALEMIHTYSLIHDDLPCMDDDDLRRGKPTNHKVYGEAMAVLAGDGLLTYSFQLLSEIDSNTITTDQKLRLINELAKAAGPTGMVAGQVADMEGENRNLTLSELEYIHTHKTGKLLNFAVISGAILANADRNLIDKLEKFAYHIGIAFQIRDDILDVEGSEEELGKNVGSDTSKNKSTYPNLLTLEGAKIKLNEHIQWAKEILQELPIDTEELLTITDMIGKRKK